MKATITFQTGDKQVVEISEIFYNKAKIVLFEANGGFTSFFHGDKVEITIENV